MRLHLFRATVPMLLAATIAAAAAPAHADTQELSAVGAIVPVECFSATYEAAGASGRNETVWRLTLDGVVVNTSRGPLYQHHGVAPDGGHAQLFADGRKVAEAQVLKCYGTAGAASPAAPGTELAISFCVGPLHVYAGSLHVATIDRRCFILR